MSTRTTLSLTAGFISTGCGIFRRFQNDKASFSALNLGETHSDWIKLFRRQFQTLQDTAEYYSLIQHTLLPGTVVESIHITVN